MSAALPPLPAEDLAHVLAHTGELWRGARGARFFVTGGTGFFGTWLLESFARANDTWQLGMRATVLSRDPAAFARKAPHLASRDDLDFVAGDMRSFAFPAGEFRFVIHAASETSIAATGADPASICEAIIEGTHRVLDFAAQAGVRKFLLTSSGAVYGVQQPDQTHVSEDSASRPVTGYGQGKLAAEGLTLERAQAAGFECKIARCFAFVGPHLPLDSHFAIGNFMRDALRGGPMRVEGDGTPRRSYLYAADLAVWLWTLLFVASAGRTYNVGSASEVSIADVARAVASASGYGVPVEILTAPQAGAPVTRYIPAIDRAAQELGLRVRIPLDEAIRRTMAWLLTSPPRNPCESGDGGCSHRAG